MRVKVKVCGITRLDDAIAAIEAGADYLGFILYPPSPRYIRASEIASISRKLRKRDDCPILVGVFVNEDAAAAADILKSAHLDLAQLSGDEPPKFVTSSESPIYGRCYKGIQPRTASEAMDSAEQYAPMKTAANSPQLLVDAYHKTLRGGTGEIGDWHIAEQLAGMVPQLMLAGGLSPENIAKAIETVAPFAVDVSSGVEESPGIKDHDKIRAFIRSARSMAI